MASSKQYKILVVGKVPPVLGEKLKILGDVAYLDRNGAVSETEVIAAARDVDFLLTEPSVPVTKNLIAACTKLKIIAQRAVGYDNINLEDCAERPILVTNTPGVLDNATADLAFALMLAAGRRLIEADRYVRDGQWKGFENDLLLGTEITGRTMGIVGMGRIGSAMARRASGFGMRIIYTRAADTAAGLDDAKVEASCDEKDRQWQRELQARRVSLDTLLKNADFISLHCPHNKETEKLIGEREFGLMKNNCVFVNTARGKVVDEEALCRALQDQKIKAAGLDVFANEPTVSPYLLQAPNVVVAPHIGSASEETRFAMAELAVNSLFLALEGQPPPNLLNVDVFQRWCASFADSTVQKV